LASSGQQRGLDVAAAPLDATGLPGSQSRLDLPVDSPISLQYPNGRVHETTLPTSGELRPGHRFELYGRHWEAVHLLEPPRFRVDKERRMLCFSTSGLSVSTRR
jgi:hypothetical protein